MGGILVCKFLATVTAVCQIRFSAPVGIDTASRPAAQIAKASLSRKRHVRYTPSARPSASNPGPRLALEAGTRTVNHGLDLDEQPILKKQKAAVLCGDRGLENIPGERP